MDRLSRRRPGFRSPILKSTMNQSYDLLKEEIRFYGRAFHKEARAEKLYPISSKDGRVCVRARTKEIPAR